MANVLVTDGNQRAALAVTRSLGAKGIRVITADLQPNTLSSASKHAYCSEIYPSHDDTKAYIQSIKEMISRHDIKIIFPITEISLFTLLKHRSEFQNVEIPFDSFENVSLLSDKVKLIELCKKLNIPYPKSFYVEHGRNVIDTNLDFQFPVVLKPHKSRIFEDGRWISTSVKYAYSDDELRNYCLYDPVFSLHPFMIQEYIEGFGQGVFLLFDHGKLVATFCHKRLREKPPTGGVSVLCESIEIPKNLAEMSTNLLSSVDWHGVAMVEFKVHEHRGPFIMEVNTRFWGSLQLAVDSGIDFPHLLYKISQGDSFTPVTDYKNNIRLRWLMGDLDRLYIVLKSDTYPPKSKLIELKKFLILFGRGMHYEVNRIGDLKPFLEELKQYFSQILKRGSG